MDLLFKCCKYYFNTDLKVSTHTCTNSVHSILFVSMITIVVIGPNFISAKKNITLCVQQSNLI